MKNIFYIFLLFLLPLFGVSQEKTINEPAKKEEANYKNQIDLDLEVFGLTLGYKKRVFNNWFVVGGMGGGLLITKSHSTFKYKDPLGFNKLTPTYLESFHIDIGIKYSFKEFLTFEIGPRYSMVGNEPRDGLGVSKLSLYTSFFAGFKYAQIGVRFMFFNKYESNFSNETYTSSLIILRIPLNRW
ncbi:MAG: hypothetical protein ACPGSO_07810 [Vicingaceae bacterium]